MPMVISNAIGKNKNINMYGSGENRSIGWVI